MLCKMADRSKRVDFETALQMTGSSYHSLCTLLLCGSTVTAMFFEIYSTTYLVPASSCEIQSRFSAETIISLPVMGLFCTAHNLGFIADNKGRRKVMVVCVMLGSVASILSAFSPNWFVLGLLKFISGGLVGCGFSISNTLLSECTPKEKRNAWIILLNTGFMLALGLMTVIASPVLSLTFSYNIPVLGIQFNSWRLLSLVFTIPSVIAAVSVHWLLESPSFLLSAGKEETALEVLRSMYVRNTGKSGDSYKVEGLVLNEQVLDPVPTSYLKGIMARTKPFMRRPMMKYTQLLSWLLTVLYICKTVYVYALAFFVMVVKTSLSNGDSHLTLCQMMKDYPNTTNEQDQKPNCSVNNSIVSVVFGISMILAIINIIFGCLVNHLGRKNLFIAIQLASGIAALGINISNNVHLTAILMLIYLTGVVNIGILTSYSLDMYPTFYKATAISLLQLMGHAQSEFLSKILRRLLENHCMIVIYGLGFFGCLGGFLGVLLPSEEKILQIKKPVAVTENTDL